MHQATRLINLAEQIFSLLCDSLSEF